MSLNLTTLRVSIYDIFTPLLGTLIWANPDDDRPALPYWDVMINPITKVGGNDYQGTPDDITELATFTGTREFTLQFRSFGNTGIQKLTDLYDAVEKPSVLASIAAEGLVFVQFMGGVSDITQIVNSTFEERGVLDMQMRTASQYTDDVGVIDEVVATMSYKNVYDTISTELITITA